MSYASQQDMVDRYGMPRMLQLTDRADPPAGVVDTVLLARHLDDAAAVIDGYLVGRYALPMQVVPAILKVHNCTLALRSLMGDTADEALLADCKQLYAWLTGVAQGDVQLMPPEVDASPAGPGSVLFSPGQKVMGRDDTGCAERGFWG